jgi:hypothetical protein
MDPAAGHSLAITEPPNGASLPSGDQPCAMTLEHVGLLAPRRRSPENDDVFYLRQKAKEAQGALAQLRRSLPQKIAAATQRLGAEREVLHQRLLHQEREMQALLTRCARQGEAHERVARAHAKSQRREAELERELRQVREQLRRAEGATAVAAAAEGPAAAAAAQAAPSGCTDNAGQETQGAPPSRAQPPAAHSAQPAAQPPPQEPPREPPPPPQQHRRRSGRGDALPWSERRQREIQVGRTAAVNSSARCGC